MKSYQYVILFVIIFISIGIYKINSKSVSLDYEKNLTSELLNNSSSFYRYTEESYLVDDKIRIDNLSCISKIKRNLSYCSNDINNSEFIFNCIEDYNLFIGIIDKNLNLCDKINNSESKNFCYFIIYADLKYCNNSVCKKISENNFKLDDNFCETLMDSEIGISNCIAVISENETMCR